MENPLAKDQRIRECQALFTEALRRYKLSRDEDRLKYGTASAEGRRTDMQLIGMALNTLNMNGFTQQEITEAMTKRIAR